MAEAFKRLTSCAFAWIFQSWSVVLIVLTLVRFVQMVVAGEEEIIPLVIKSINTLIISLAMFELGVGIGKEYSVPQTDENVYLSIRRTITRFVGTVCIALVMEALIMIIKYSQLELAGNLYYPVGILFGSSTLLISLGVFLWLSQGHTE